MLFRLMDSTVITVSLISNVCAWKDELRQKSDKRLVIGGKSQPENCVYLAQRETTDTEWSGSINEVRATRRRTNKKKESKPPESTAQVATSDQPDSWNPVANNDERFICLSCHKPPNEPVVSVEMKTQSTTTDDDSDLSSDDYMMEYIKSVTNCKLPNRYKTAQIKDFVSNFPVSEGRRITHFPNENQVSNMFRQPEIHRGSSSATWMSALSRDELSPDSSAYNDDTYDSEPESPRQTVRHLREKLSKSMRDILEVETYKIKGVDKFIRGDFANRSQGRINARLPMTNRDVYRNDSTIRGSMSPRSQYMESVSVSRSESESDAGTSEVNTLDEDAQRLLLCRENR